MLSHRFCLPVFLISFFSFFLVSPFLHRRKPTHIYLFVIIFCLSLQFKEHPREKSWLKCIERYQNRVKIITDGKIPANTHTILRWKYLALPLISGGKKRLYTTWFQSHFFRPNTLWSFVSSKLSFSQHFLSKKKKKIHKVLYRWQKMLNRSGTLW